MSSPLKQLVYIIVFNRSIVQMEKNIAMCITVDSKNQRIILSYNYFLLYYDQETLEYQEHFQITGRHFLDLGIQPFTNNLLIYHYCYDFIDILSNEKKILAKIKVNGEVTHFNECALCCLPNGNICLTGGFWIPMKIYDSSGRLLLNSPWRDLEYLSNPLDICYLDRWNAPSSSASSLIVYGSKQPKTRGMGCQSLQTYLKY